MTLIETADQMLDDVIAASELRFGKADSDDVLFHAGCVVDAIEEHHHVHLTLVTDEDGSVTFHMSRDDARQFVLDQTRTQRAEIGCADTDDEFWLDTMASNGFWRVHH